MKLAASGSDDTMERAKLNLEIIQNTGRIHRAYAMPAGQQITARGGVGIRAQA
jgi:hypothetical protein